MNLTRTTQYALRILSLMASDPNKVYTSIYLYKKLEIPKKYLQRLLTDLSKNSLIESIQGRSGGFSIARKTDKIYLSEIIEAVEGFQKEPSCFFGFETCILDNPCAMHDVWSESQKSMINILSKTKLSDLNIKTEKD